MEIRANQEDVVRTLEDTTNKLKSVLRAKGRDYSGEIDTFRNFKLSAELLKVDVKKVILSRLLDKVSRLCNVIDKGNSVKNETVEDTLDDLVGYVALLKTYIKKEQREHTTVVIDDDGEY